MDIVRQARRSVRKAVAAGRASMKLLFKPLPFWQKRSTLSQKNSHNEKFSLVQFISTLSWAKIEAMMFPNMPEHYPLSKKLALAKSQSRIGQMWDVLLIFLSVLACAIYVSETYTATFEAVRVYDVIEMVVTQFFAADFVYNYLSAASTYSYMLDPWTHVDIITVMPVYVTLILRETGQGAHGFSFSVFRFVRILRLIRILRVFKLLNGLSGVQRQLVTLSLTLVSLVFMAAGIIHIMENDLKQSMYYDCNFIGEKTNWEPSCDRDLPFEDIADTCDCNTLKYKCIGVYNAGDKNGEPTGISCSVMTFLDAFYFLVVTVSTVGYGDINPTTQVSRAVVVLFIITSVVLIPMQVNELTVLLAANSAYRQPYNSSTDESHVIICGYIGDCRKLEKFFKEFFHPDRHTSASPDFHAVILSPVEPSDDLKSQLLYSSHLDGKITYIIGSSLSTDDLQKARADLASAMFFFCNAETPEENAKLDDAATVLRTLSVSNFNPSLECFVQVLRPEDRDILKDSDVDVILCLDEYKTCIQARNSVCPGLSTLVENMFHSFATPSIIQQENSMLNSWVDDYSWGASMEPYYIPLVSRYCEMLSYEWTLMVEGIYLEYGCQVIGVASSSDHSLLLNPGKKEMKKYQYNSRFFKKYNMLIILCTEQSLATSISHGMADPNVIDRILNKILIAEDNFTIRRTNDKEKHHRVQEKKNKFVLSSLRDIIRVTKSWSGHQTVPQDDNSDENDDYAGFIEKVGKTSAKKAKKIANINRISHVAGQARAGDDSSDSDDEGSGASQGPSPSASGKTSMKDMMRRMSSFNTQAMARAKQSVKHGDTPPNSPLVNPSSAGMGSGYMEDDSVAVTAAVVSDTVAKTVDDVTGEEIITNLIVNAHHLKGHVVVFGSVQNLILFLAELRRPVHNLDPESLSQAVIVVNETTPPGWGFICQAFTNVFFIKGKMTRSADFNRTNTANAKSVVLLAGRDNVTRVEEENLDAEALFAYLKLEKYIRKEVFFTVELTCASNMAVLNSTVMRRTRRAMSMQKKNDSRVNKRKAEKSVSKNGENKMSSGTFSSHKAIMNTSYYDNLSRGIMNILATVPARRISSIEAKNDSRAIGTSRRKNQKLESFWTSNDSHHMLSVFASGNAFVPATFDSIMAQSFYTAFTPLLLERMVCGSKHQSLYQIEVPMPFISRYFVDLYRAFMSRGLMVIAIYRAPVATEGATLPFVYTSPKPDTQMRFQDKIFILANPDTLRENLPVLSEHLNELPDGTLALGDTLGVQLGETGHDRGKGSGANSEEQKQSGGDAGESPGQVHPAAYKYLMPNQEGPNVSPLKEKVSRVFFQGTEVPL